MHTIISKEQLYDMIRAEEREGKENIVPTLRTQEIDGLLFSIWVDKKDGKEYAVREIRTVHFGLNSIEEDRVQQFIAIVEREGACKASWGVTGRTAHLMLANKLEAKLPQYQFTNDYDGYLCLAKKRYPDLVPMPGTTDPDWGEKHWGQK